MKKVLIISDRLEHYRIPLYESLTDTVDLTVAYSNNIIEEDFKFNKYIIGIASRGPFIVYKNLPYLDNFDVVIFPFNIRCIQLIKFLFVKNKFKLFVFGIGVSASYNKFYDADKKLDFIRYYILKKSDGGIFYEKYPEVKYVSMGISPLKLSVAYNTVSSNLKFDFQDKTFESFIFIGSLYKQKKIFDLLNAYQIVVRENSDKIPLLEIVGSGDESENIKKWIETNSLGSKVILHGALNKDEELSPIFQRAIACISPGQAGLSVQKCFSYGVPFITSINSITGGEALSIIDKETGFIYDSSIVGLAKVLNTIVRKDIDIKDMSEKCYIFYKNFRNVNIWKDGFLRNIIK